MATSSLIGFYNEFDGSVVASYCHYDGFLPGVGATLVESYNTENLANAIAYCGNMPCLESSLANTQASQKPGDNFKALKFQSVDEYMHTGHDAQGVDYLYLFDGEAWFYSTRVRLPFEEVEANLEAT